MADAATKAPGLRNVPEEELQSQLHNLRQELWQSRLKAKTGALQQTHQMQRARRSIARILTILKERHG